MNVIEQTRKVIKEEIQQCIANISTYNRFDDLAERDEKACDKRPFAGQAASRG